MTYFRIIAIFLIKVIFCDWLVGLYGMNSIKRITSKHKYQWAWLMLQKCFTIPNQMPFNLRVQNCVVLNVLQFVQIETIVNANVFFCIKV